MTTVGVLALQGDVREHEAALARLGVHTVRVRRPGELDHIDALVLPGGESTTIDRLLRVFEVAEPLKERLDAGMPVLGTCAGMILLASTIVGGTDEQRCLGVIDMAVRRNAFGRQVDSSEVHLTWRPDGSSMHAAFIRAPWVESYGDKVEVLAVNDAAGGHVVAVRQGNAIATSFHPEVSGDDRVHALLVDIASSVSA